MNKVLTDEMMVFVKESYKENSAPEVIEMLKEKYGVSVTKQTIYKNTKKKIKYKQWQGWELKYLKENYTEENKSGISKFLNRSKSAIEVKHKELESKEKWERKEEDNEVVKTRYEQFETIDLKIGDIKKFIINGVEQHKRANSYISKVIKEYKNHFVVEDDCNVKRSISKANLFCGAVEIGSVI